MKFIPHSDFENISNTLNFETAAAKVSGGCELYTVKAAGADKKLYKRMEKAIVSENEAIEQYIDGLPAHHAVQARESLNLSRDTPFGSLKQPPSRKAFMYFIATLNATYPGHDFSHYHPLNDFRGSFHFQQVRDDVNATLHQSRLRYSTDYQDRPIRCSNAVLPAHLQVHDEDEVWEPYMWEYINQEMDLEKCSIYSFKPAEIFEGDRGALYGFNYFFYNRRQKRACYFHIKVTSHLDSVSPSPESPNRSKRPSSGTWSLDGETSTKKARYRSSDSLSDDGSVGPMKHNDGFRDEGYGTIDISSDSETSNASPSTGRGGYGNQNEPFYVSSDEEVGDEEPEKVQERVEIHVPSDDETDNEKSGKAKDHVEKSFTADDTEKEKESTGDLLGITNEDTAASVESSNGKSHAEESITKEVDTSKEVQPAGDMLDTINKETAPPMESDDGKDFTDKSVTTNDGASKEEEASTNLLGTINEESASPADP